MTKGPTTLEIYTGDWPADEQRDATLKELMIHGFIKARDAFSECGQIQSEGFPKELIPHFPYLILALEMTNGYSESDFQKMTDWRFWDISRSIANKFCTIYRVALSSECGLPSRPEERDWVELLVHGHRVLSFYINCLQKNVGERKLKLAEIIPTE